MVRKEGIVIRRIMVLMCLAGCLGIGHRALAQDFSADVVSNKQGNGGLSKIYSTKDKARWEIQEKNPGMGPSALIVDEAQSK
jgi:hypothetical protein